jgi:tetratricopeptide (TPR) repeat protein
MSRLLILAVFLLCLPLAAQATPPPAPAVSPTIDQGLAALRAGQPAQALAIFQQILTADPKNAVADLYAATAAMEQYNGQLAVQYAEKARDLDPKSWKIHTTLVAAYATAGMKEQRDKERATLAQLHASGAPDARQANGFLVEMFPVGDARVDAIQYFQPVGRFHTYYRFIVHQRAGGTAPQEIDVQSNDFDQKSWAQAHPAQAAAGERQFQITDAAGVKDYRMFSGKPDYDTIRPMVVAVLKTRSPQ